MTDHRVGEGREQKGGSKRENLDQNLREGLRRTKKEQVDLSRVRLEEFEKN